MRCYIKRNVVMFLLCIMAIFMVCSFVGCKPVTDPNSSPEKIITELDSKAIGFKVSLPAKSRAYYTQDDASKYVVDLVMNRYKAIR